MTTFSRGGGGVCNFLGLKFCLIFCPKFFARASLFLAMKFSALSFYGLDSYDKLRSIYFLAVPQISLLTGACSR